MGDVSMHKFSISFEGALASKNAIEFYDVAHALVGFQRTLAITTHLLINGKVITQAPALKGAQIHAFPPEPGSWKFVATVVGGLYVLGQAQQNSVLGHLATSAYDYVISESLGFHVDFQKTLLQQYEEAKKRGVNIQKQPQSKFDSVIEKCENSIKEMHRPIIWSETALSAKITSTIDGKSIKIAQPLTSETYEYVSFTGQDDEITEFVGRISGYNINTFKGRVFVGEEKRPIPFELADSARDDGSVSLITHSISINAVSANDPSGDLFFRGFRRTSTSGRLKGYFIVQVYIAKQ